MRQLPPSRIAVFLYGLRRDSRIKLRLTGLEYTLTEQLLVGIFDKVNWLQWANSKAAKEGEGPPKPLASILFGNEEKVSDIVAYDTPEEFEKQRRRIIEGR